jgi:hypothetical protein
VLQILFHLNACPVWESAEPAPSLEIQANPQQIPPEAGLSLQYEQPIN